MSKIALEGNASGTGTLTIAAPNTSTNRTLTLPDESGVIDRLNRAGNVLQVVNASSGTYATTTNLMPLDNTIPQNTEGAEFLTLSITPTSSTSKLFISTTAILGTTVGGTWVTLALFQDSTVNALAASAAYFETNGGGVSVPLNYFMTAGTTSTTTFKLRYGPNGNTGAINGSTIAFFNGIGATSITIMEIAA